MAWEIISNIFNLFREPQSNKEYPTGKDTTTSPKVSDKADISQPNNNYDGSIDIDTKLGSTETGSMARKNELSENFDVPDLKTQSAPASMRPTRRYTNNYINSGISSSSSENLLTMPQTSISYDHLLEAMFPFRRDRLRRILKSVQRNEAIRRRQERNALTESQRIENKVERYVFRSKDKLCAQIFSDSETATSCPEEEINRDFEDNSSVMENSAIECDDLDYEMSENEESEYEESDIEISGSSTFEGDESINNVEDNLGKQSTESIHDENLDAVRNITTLINSDAKSIEDTKVKFDIYNYDIEKDYFKNEVENILTHDDTINNEVVVLSNPLNEAKEIRINRKSFTQGDIENNETKASEFVNSVIIKSTKDNSIPLPKNDEISHSPEKNLIHEVIDTGEERIILDSETSNKCLANIKIEKDNENCPVSNETENNISRENNFLKQDVTTIKTKEVLHHTEYLEIQDRVDGDSSPLSIEEKITHSNETNFVPKDSQAESQIYGKSQIRNNKFSMANLLLESDDKDLHVSSDDEKTTESYIFINREESSHPISEIPDISQVNESPKQSEMDLAASNEERRSSLEKNIQSSLDDDIISNPKIENKLIDEHENTCSQFTSNNGESITKNDKLLVMNEDVTNTLQCLSVSTFTENQNSTDVTTVDNDQNTLSELYHQNLVLEENNNLDGKNEKLIKIGSTPSIDRSDHIIEENSLNNSTISTKLKNVQQYAADENIFKSNILSDNIFIDESSCAIIPKSFDCGTFEELAMSLHIDEDFIPTEEDNTSKIESSNDSHIGVKETEDSSNCLSDNERGVIPSTFSLKTQSFSEGAKPIEAPASLQPIEKNTKTSEELKPETHGRATTNINPGFCSLDKNTLNTENDMDEYDSINFIVSPENFTEYYSLTHIDEGYISYATVENNAPLNTSIQETSKIPIIPKMNEANSDNEQTLFMTKLNEEICLPISQNITSVESISARTDIADSKENQNSTTVTPSDYVAHVPCEVSTAEKYEDKSSSKSDEAGPKLSLLFDTSSYNQCITESNDNLKQETQMSDPEIKVIDASNAGHDNVENRNKYRMEKGKSFDNASQKKISKVKKHFSINEKISFFNKCLSKDKSKIKTRKEEVDNRDNNIGKNDDSDEAHEAYGFPQNSPAQHQKRYKKYNTIEGMGRRTTSLIEVEAPKTNASGMPGKLTRAMRSFHKIFSSTDDEYSLKSGSVSSLRDLKPACDNQPIIKAAVVSPLTFPKKKQVPTSASLVKHARPLDLFWL